MLDGARIVLGVTGGIAAYKAVDVCRRLVDAGAHVSPVMTKGAERFIGRTTLSALASEPVQTDLWDGPSPIPHTRLGQQADLVVVAPATARLIGAYAAGLSTDLLTNVLLATRAPVVICPAMHTEMWEHPAVADNIALLRRRGVHVVEPAVGRLAGGDSGRGRLADPVDIVAAVERILDPRPRDLAGVSVVVTAGGTREPIDAVRVIANRSSGKQGHAIAADAAERGADVVLITTVELPVAAGVSVVRVETAAELQAAVEAHADADVIVMAAAVADFRPKVAAEGKIKKHEGVPEIVLEPTPDILAGLGRAKRPGQVLRRLRRRDRRPARQRHRQAGRQARRPGRRQRRQRAGRRIRPRHQRRRPPATRPPARRRGAARQAGHRPRRPRRRRRDPRMIPAAAIPPTHATAIPTHPRHPLPDLGAPVSRWTFTSESVTEGHPDKMADQISDSVLDAILAEDPNGRVACETLLTTGLCVVAGEITTEAYVDIPKLARETIKSIGYDDAHYGFDGGTCGVIVSIDEQSPNIAQGVDVSEELRGGTAGEDYINAQGAGDQGMMFGFACDETPDLMPLPIWTAHRLAERLAEVRKSGQVPYLRPDGKTQVTYEYEDGKPVALKTVLISTQHQEGVDRDTVIRPDLIDQVIRPTIPAQFADDAYDVWINPTGTFVLGGPHADCGLTGRKIIVDTYGGMGRHGGGAFSGKDPSKVDRSAAYAARWVAKHVVASGAATRCEVQVAYAIGMAHPMSILVETFGTNTVDESKIEQAVRETFDLRPGAIVRDLDLKRPIFRDTAAYGHFGRSLPGFSWEHTTRLDDFKAAVGL